jgi:hypothetical protein
LQNRLLALPFEAPIWRVVEDEHEKAQAAQQASEIEDVLARFKT